MIASVHNRGYNSTNDVIDHHLQINQFINERARSNETSNDHMLLLKYIITSIVVQYLSKRKQRVLPDPQLNTISDGWCQRQSIYTGKHTEVTDAAKLTSDADDAPRLQRQRL